MILVSGPIHFIPLESGGFELTHDWWVDLPFDIPAVRASKDGVRIQDKYLYVKKGFKWDGASGPTVDPSYWVIPPFVHDVGYRLLRYKAWGDLPKDEHARIRKGLDDTFLQLMLEHPPPKAGWFRRQIAKGRAWAWWSGVRLFAGYAAKPTARPGEKEAA